MTASTLDLAVLHRATTDGSLELQYQPEVELATGAIVAMKGLLRWHYGAQLLEPGSFLAVAVVTGERAAIGGWVLRTGAAEAASWSDLPGPARQLWLDVDAEQLRDRALSSLVAEVVRDHHLRPGALGLEVSERTVLDLGADALPVLRDLRAAGVSLAVDDLTSFYATLGAIETLPVDAVTLSHRYVRGVGDAGHDDAMVATVIDRAHERGIYVVAEGVQTWGEGTRLTELGCDRAHGWLFASPQRADRTRWLLTQGTGWRGGQVTPDVHARPFPPAPRVLVL